MAIKPISKLHANRKVEIDLTGPDGNAYVLLSFADKYAKRLGKDSEKILSEMKSGDYENLLKVFDREFGDCVDLYR